MALKCVHKGCGKVFTDADEPCTYHPGPPEFHEGQKGWKCCKPRVLTFDEFMAIPPCTTGKHSTVDDTPKPELAVTEDDPAATPAARVPEAQPPATARLPLATPEAPKVPSPAPEPESEDDDPSLPVPAKATCRRRACNAESTEATQSDRSAEKCVFHPGVPIFHEGSKGWTCCKRRVLEFDEFMKLEGCQTKDRHMFVGSGKKGKGKHAGATSTGVDGVGEDGEKLLESVRHDFYQTPTQVHATLFLKKIVKERAKAIFSATAVDVDLPTSDGTRYAAHIPLYGPIDPEKSTIKVMGTKCDLTLVKFDGRSWPVLRADERDTGEIIQAGDAGRA